VLLEYIGKCDLVCWKVYQKCLLYELGKNGLKIDVEVEIPVIYDGIDMGCDFRVDLIVNDGMIVELKAVQELNDLPAVVNPFCTLN